MYKELVEQYGSRIRTHAVEVKMDTSNGKYYLPDDAILRNKTCVGIFTQGNPDDNRYVPGSDRPLPPDATLDSAYLSLFNNNVQMLEDHPLRDLAVDKNDRTVRQFMFADITPSKSYITVADAGNKVTTGDSFLLHFVYLD